MDDLRGKLTIGADSLKEVNTFLLDPDNLARALNRTARVLTKNGKTFLAAQ